MTTIKKLVCALAAVAAGVSVYAQTAPANPADQTNSSGLLGHRYAEYSFGFVDINKTSTDAFAAGLAINLPVAPSFDVTLDYTYAWREGHSNIHSNDLSATGIYYFNAGKVKPFGGLSLGYDWNRGDDAANWGAVAGVEYELTPQVVLTGSVGYEDDFRSGDNSTWDGTVRANYWFTHDVSVYGAFSLIEGGNLGYAVGLTLKF